MKTPGGAKCPAHFASSVTGCARYAPHIGLPGLALRPMPKPHVIARALRARGKRSERRRWRMKRGNRRSTACGRISEAISRKCPDWRPLQWPPIGWHDGGPERVSAVKIGGVRRKAARKFWAPQQGHPHSLALHPLHCIPCHADRGVLSANSGRKYPKNAVKTHGFEILSAPGIYPMWKPSCPAYQTLKFTAVLSYRLCAAIRWPLTRARAALVRPGFCVYRPARCGHRALCKLRTYFRRGDPRGRPPYRKLAIPP